MATAAATHLSPLPPHAPVTLQSLKGEIGIVQNFFLAKLHANGDDPLVEDEDLPLKQRFPKPRLPPTGKITSPRKRPAKEQGGRGKAGAEAGKKRKVGDGAGAAANAITNANPNANLNGVAAEAKVGEKPVGKLKLTMPGMARESGADKKDALGLGKENAKDGDDGDDAVPASAGDKGMMSPESIVAG